MSATKSKIAESAERLRQAEEAVQVAKSEHREAFRVALVALFNEYGFYLDANGSEGADLEICELHGTEYPIGDLPE